MTRRTTTTMAMAAVVGLNAREISTPALMVASCDGTARTPLDAVTNTRDATATSTPPSPYRRTSPSSSQLQTSSRPRRQLSCNRNSLLRLLPCTRSYRGSSPIRYTTRCVTP
uniref:Uncharacterized protein n=1 Tax=Arundo donax TaxID=35708 RepID=A0A0A9GUA6_ARUDO